MASSSGPEIAARGSTAGGNISAGAQETAAIGIIELESAVRRLLASHSDMRVRALEAEARGRALQDALRAASGEPDAVAITDRLAVLEHENTELRNRLAEATAIAARIAARIQFAEQES